MVQRAYTRGVRFVRESYEYQSKDNSKTRQTKKSVEQRDEGSRENEDERTRRFYDDRHKVQDERREK